MELMTSPNNEDTKQGVSAAFGAQTDGGDGMHDALCHLSRLIQKSRF
jgi:hypothetical protein